MDRVTVGRIRNPKDNYRLGYAMHVPGRKNRVLMNQSQWDAVRTYMNPLRVDLIKNPKEYEAWREKRRALARARR